MLCKTSSARTVVALQSENMLQIPSGNHNALWQSPVIHPHPSCKFGRPQKLALRPTWEALAEIPELQRAMLPRLAASQCEEMDRSASQNSIVIHHELQGIILSTYFFKNSLSWSFWYIYFCSQVSDFTICFLDPTLPLCSSPLKYRLDAWLQMLCAFLLVSSPRYSLWKPQLEPSILAFQPFQGRQGGWSLQDFQNAKAFVHGNRRTTTLVLNILI